MQPGSEDVARLFFMREAKKGFGDNVPKQVLGRQPYRFHFHCAKR